MRFILARINGKSFFVGEGPDFFKAVGPAEFENRRHDCRLAFSDGENAEARAVSRGASDHSEFGHRRQPI